MTSSTVAGIDLMELAGRVEAATADEAERTELGVEVNEALGIASYITDDGDPCLSVDAAMTLVPQGWYWMAGNRDRLTPRAYVENGQPAFMGYSNRRNPYRQWFEVTAATPALALTAAALRARASLIEEERS